MASTFTLAAPRPFIIDPTAIGKSETTFTATYMDFSYRAEIDQWVDKVHHFAETGVGFFSAFQHPSLGSPLNATTTGLNNTYKLYALFSGTGTSATNGFGGLDGSFNHFTVNIYADVNMDTTLGDFTNGMADGNEIMTVEGVTVDDILVGTSGELWAGDFRVFPGLANGDFNIIVKIHGVNTGIGTGLFFAFPFEFGLHMDFSAVHTLVEGIALPHLNH